MKKYIVLDQITSHDFIAEPLKDRNSKTYNKDDMLSENDIDLAMIGLIEDRMEESRQNLIKYPPSPKWLGGR